MNLWQLAALLPPVGKLEWVRGVEALLGHSKVKPANLNTISAALAGHKRKGCSGQPRQHTAVCGAPHSVCRAGRFARPCLHAADAAAGGYCSSCWYRPLRLRLTAAPSLAGGV